MSTAIRLSGITKRFPGVVALKNVGFEIQTGEVHCLVGENGAGKSTLIKLLAGVEQADEGTIELFGKQVCFRSPEEALRAGVGVVYQELSNFVHLDVATNLNANDFPEKGGMIDYRALYRRTREQLDDCGLKYIHEKSIMRELSLGTQQMVEIASLIGQKARVVILDEPTSALDRAQVDRFFEILRELKQKGRSMIFISHRMDEIFAIGDRATVIRDGRIVGTRRIAETKPAEIIALMVGGQDELAPQNGAAQAAPAEAGPAVLSVKGLSGRGFSDVSFEVRKGEILGFGGLHGQGQSAVLRALFGAVPPSAGAISLNADPLDPASPRATIRHGAAYVSGDRVREGVVTGRSIFENVMPIHYLRNRMLLARPAAMRPKALDALRSMHTKFAGLGASINSLSGGNQQKVVIARWLIDRPDVLLLDDPTKGIDLSAKADLFALIRELAGEGMAIVLYSSEDAELLNNADRILVLNGDSVRREMTDADRTSINLYHAAYEAA